MTTTAPAREATAAATSAHPHHGMPVPPPRLPLGEVPSEAGLDGPGVDATGEDPGGRDAELGDA